MRLSDLSHSAIAATVADMPQSFRTTDVSRHARMRQAHGSVWDERSYNSCVGRYLSAHRADLGLKLVDETRHDRGVLWQRT